jgi:hypothetical protein
MSADGIAKKAVADLMATRQIESTAYSEMLSDHSVDLSLGMVIVDNAAGADRVDVEFKNMFETRDLMPRGWVEVILWSSNKEPAKDAVRMAPCQAVHRTLYQLHCTNFDVESLRGMPDQEKSLSPNR